MSDQRLPYHNQNDTPESIPLVLKNIQEVLKLRFDNFEHNHDVLEAKVEASIAFHKDIAVQLTQIQDRMVTREEHSGAIRNIRAIVDNNTVRIDNLIKEKTDRKDWAKTLFPVLIAMVIASFGLEITTLLFLINHVVANH